MFNGEYKNHWMVEFYRSNSQEITGEGDAQRIFATVLHAIQQFIKKKKPKSIFFTAVKEDDPKGSRTKLYNRLVQRFASGLGYSLTTQADDYGTSYKLVRIKNVKQGVAESQTAKAGIVQTDVYGTRAYHAKCLEPGCDWESKRYDRIQQAQAAAKKHSEQHFKQKQGVTEAIDLDRAYPIEQWYENDEYAMVAEAHDADGRLIEVIFTPLLEEDNPVQAIDFDFRRNKSYEQTNEGDASRVFATALNALAIYLKNYYTPDYISFGSKGQSRTSLYTAMIKRFAGKFGYKEVAYDSLPKEITDQPRPPGHMFALALNH
jgi:hypothetical protein